MFWQQQIIQDHWYVNKSTYILIEEDSTTCSFSSQEVLEKQSSSTTIQVHF
jgi:hypothetical protein